MSGRTDISPDAQETNINETTLDDTDRARIAAEEAARQAEWDAKMAAYEAKWRTFQQRQADVLARNKATLFQALAAACIDTVTVMFDGSGDSGQIESVETFDAAANPAVLPEALINIAGIEFESLETRITPISPREAIENMVYAFLEQTHDGWENGDGAYGAFTFTVADQSISLEYNERYTDTHYYQHEF
jgi:hypothetical protein